jgi:predicted DNA-binding transcriptional regulator YafY
MVELRKLKAKMVERDVTAAELAKALEVDTSTLYRKFQNAEKLTVRDVRKMSEVLTLSADDITAIFFAPDVA